MGREKNIFEFYRRYTIRSQALATSFAHPPRLRTNESCSRPHELGREGALIQLQDYWATFVRGVVLTSATKKIVTASGNRFSNPYPDEPAALQALRSTFSGQAGKPPWWEPTWFDPVQVIDAANRLALPNAAQLSLGYGMTPSPLEEMRAIRNFFAHRTKRTASQVSRVVGVKNSEEMHNFLAAPVVGGATRFEQWAAQLSIMARTMVD